MTPTREAIVLPLLFLTVTLLGGVRVGAHVALIVPSVVAFVLSALLIGALVRGNALNPGLLVNGERTALENASGIIVLATLLFASAQIFNLITPERGLLHLLFTAFFFMQVLTTLAGAGGRRQLLRSIAVLLGCAFVLRWIVLENLYAVDTGTAKRVLTLLVEGISLGAIDYEAHAPVTGYVALLTIGLYLAALWLLAPSRPQITETAIVVRPRTGELMILVLAATLGLAACQDTSTKEKADGSTAQEATADGDAAARLRDSALRSARVWHPPAVPIGSVRFSENPRGQGSFGVNDEVTCRFVVKKVGGTTPKFDCELPGGDVVRVKYGTTNPEIHAEVAASRLLTALGFESDRMFVVKRVRCRGCPQFPFQSLKCLDDIGVKNACFAGGLDYSSEVAFNPAVVERRHEGSKIEAVKDQGWAWFELERIDPAQGGSPRAEVDALRLMAVLLAHWDNKAENQRLVCTDTRPSADGRCHQPIALIQDLGATFGPLKVDLANWQRTRMWADPETCTISMEDLPYKGGTFPRQQISEEGRRFLLGLVEQLSDAQLAELFDASRITAYDQLSATARHTSAWVNAFKDKVRQIREAGPCGG